MPLIDLKTDLKSLRYGKDTPGGGYSGQPYIQTSIPDGLTSKSPDFVLRNGYLAFQSVEQDVSRLSKMFLDLKSFNGIGFITKQNVLSNLSVRTQASGIINGSVYKAYSTLAQAAEVAFGGHLNKQGSNPWRETGAYANNGKLYGVAVKPNQPTSENRLVAIKAAIDEGQGKRNWNRTGFGLNIGQVNVLRYQGGPDAPGGVGLTNIRYASADQRTGLQNKYYVDNPSWFYGLNQKQISIDFNQVVSSKSLSNKYARLTDTKLNNYIVSDDQGRGQIQGTYFHSVYEPAVEGNTWPKNTPLIYANNTFTYTQQDIITNPDNDGKKVGAPFWRDFRRVVRASLSRNGTAAEQEKAKSMGATPDSPSYIDQSYEKRTNIGGKNNLGAGNSQGKNLVNYTAGSGIGPIDKINALPIYESEAVDTNKPINDLVKFRIAVINNDNPSKKTFVHFRAFLNSFSDQYQSTWQGQNYLGRGEKFYNYAAFDRTINLSFTVSAQSKNELIEQYRKLNYLASTLAPDYSNLGYMRGNLVQLTVGGYLFEQVGFIQGMTYDVPNDSPWEIGIDTNGNSDNTVKELSHMINVTGFSFIPIHNFVPSKQTIIFDDKTKEPFSYGPQRYIALSNGASNNYIIQDKLVELNEDPIDDAQLELDLLNAQEAYGGLGNISIES